MFNFIDCFFHFLKHPKTEPLCRSQLSQSTIVCLLNIHLHGSIWVVGFPGQIPCLSQQLICIMHVRTCTFRVSTTKTEHADKLLNDKHGSYRSYSRKTHVVHRNKKWVCHRTNKITLAQKKINDMVKWASGNDASFSKYQITALLKEEMHLITWCAMHVMKFQAALCARFDNQCPNSQPHVLLSYNQCIPSRYFNLLGSGLTQTLGLEGHTKVPV